MCSEKLKYCGGDWARGRLKKGKGNFGMDCTKTTTFRMNECCDKYHSPGRILLRSADGRRSVDTGRPTVDGLVVLPDSGAAGLWVCAEDVESRRGSWCRSAWFRSRRIRPTSNNTDICIRGSRFRVWGKLSPAARRNKLRRGVRVRRSRTIGRSRLGTGLNRRSRVDGTCSTGSRRSGRGRTSRADCRTDCWRWSVRRTVAGGRTGAWSAPSGELRRTAAGVVRAAGAANRVASAAGMSGSA
ncbi:hypothetical protein T03_5307 [Trichinella britovi]|uniref:Uncharacterized protein n=1 Tax=Trichinella britovi TaxID=45882 RepID=A0A0V1CEF4_TRIBR|nr:hypothetical protein T03_5307 [Trichinella britovi]